MRLISSQTSRWATSGRSPPSLISISISISIAMLLLMLVYNPTIHKVEGAKSLKSLAKTFVFQQLTMRKNFLPLPVPIPGKWQTILNTIVDSGLLKGRHHNQHHASSSSKAVVTASAAAIPSKTNNGGGGGSHSSALQMASTLVSKLPTAIKLSTKNGNKFSSQSSDSTGKKLLLFGASNLVDELSNNGKRLNKIFSGTSAHLSPASPASPAAASTTSSSSSIDMNNVKKLTRLAAAKYATYIISTQPKGKNNKQTSSSSSSKNNALVQKATDSSGGLAASEKGNNKRNDVLVTAFNVVKLAQQIRELNPTKVLSLNLSKKSGLNTSSPQSSLNNNHGTSLITGIINSPSSSSTSSAASMMASVAANAANNLASASGIVGVPSLLSMNIDNKKTLLNKMHYFHKLTYDLHHRHRNNQHHLNLVL